MNREQLIIAILQHLAWPLVALIAFFGLRKHVIDLARGTANLKELLGKSGDIMSLVDHLAQVKNEASEIKGMLEAISIRDKGKELQELATAGTETVQLGADEMFEQIRAEWSAIADAIRRLAKSAGVKSNLIGTVGVSATVDELASKGVIAQRAAEITKALSSQWQWMFRTTSPKGDWLNHSVFASFMNGAAQVKAALVTR